MLTTTGTRRVRVRRGLLLAACAAGLMLAIAPSGAHATERLAVTGLQPLLIQAIDQGEAHGVLVGPPAHYIARTFRSDAPIVIDVRTVAELEEPGCKRLAVTTAQEAVVDFNRQQRASRPERKAFTYRLNYCRDGRLPSTAKPSR